ncbi:murein hydrolase activator EnvC family protein [Luteimicrobium sp. DT211]|uniref:murein hydrolase activator EnvC family protein n=1 Tax=Luteimicrobium sp. DT211 TaxID=3393412 RepID=UPI003CE67B7E
MRLPRHPVRKQRLAPPRRPVGRPPARRGAAAVVVALAAALIAPAPGTAGAADEPPDATDAAFRVPVPGAVVRAFDPPAVRWGAGHRGVDLAAAVGDEVRAPAAGTVAFAGTVAGRGVLTLLHDDGLRSSFEPVTTTLHAGDRVGQGDPVATLDDATPGGHCLPASCVHWGVRRGETYLDPMALVATEPIVLLPLG